MMSAMLCLVLIYSSLTPPFVAKVPDGVVSEVGMLGSLVRHWIARHVHCLLVVHLDRDG